MLHVGPRVGVATQREPSMASSSVNVAPHVEAVLQSDVLSLPTLRLSRHLNAAIMTAVLGWHCTHFCSRLPVASWAKYMVFLSQWSLVLQVLYLIAVARATHAQPSAPPALANALWFMQSIALPASIATIPLYWGQRVVPFYAGATIHASTYFVHGFNAVSMIVDFRLSRRAWRGLKADAPPVIAFGLANMAFMRLYYSACGCPSGTACDLDTMGNPFVYSVVDWRRPRQATLVCLLAIFVPIPVISRGLSMLSRWWQRRDAEDDRVAETRATKEE